MRGVKIVVIISIGRLKWWLSLLCLMFLIVVESIERVFMKRLVGFVIMRGILSYIIVGIIVIVFLILLMEKMMFRMKVMMLIVM